MTIVYLYDTGLDTDRAGWIMFWCINACYVISMSVAVYKLIKALAAKIREYREQRSKRKEITNPSSKYTIPEVK
jgi:hypothetical protein